jgi:uncharacterized spore protein YtfJ
LITAALNNSAGLLMPATDVPMGATQLSEARMNQAQEILHALAERFSTTANVKQIFGEPIERGGRTIVPVARVHYLLGAGGGSGEMKNDGQPGSRSGGGGGGGGLVRARPIGALEISDSGTRFIRFVRPGEVVKACVGGLIALLIVRRLTRRRH